MSSEFIFVELPENKNKNAVVHSDYQKKIILGIDVWELLERKETISPLHPETDYQESFQANLCRPDCQTFPESITREYVERTNFGNICGGGGVWTFNCRREERGKKNRKATSPPSRKK